MAGSGKRQAGVVGDVERTIIGNGIFSGLCNQAIHENMHHRGQKRADEGAHLYGSALNLVSPKSKSIGRCKRQVMRYRQNTPGLILLVCLLSVR